MPLPSDCELNWKKDLLEIPLKQVELKFIAMTATAKVPEHVYLSNVKIGVQLAEELSRDLLIQVKAHVLGYDAKPIKVCLAATGWDSIKERFFPKWWLRRWPVEYKTLELDVRYLYPFLRPPITDSPVVTILTEKERSTTYERTD